ncbi:alpha/beta fold hydrolase [Acidaminobacter sp. JC074]|uniref:alpha/beta fold hydrolase n=1 Tax=Acidaminobacter sp. JC074 TaxID=2530199 RepID=UPI001F10195E|nr:alpha/beta hydrolase [Acidaminobacter sp. JC074]
MKIDVSMANIDYEIIGDGIPVLMIHGFSLDKHVMKGAYEPIFEKISGFKRIYLDLPVMGDSKAKEGLKTSDDMLECIIEFVDKVLGEEKFILIGQSFGGYLAQGLVSKVPDKTLGLGLVCPVVLADSDKRNLPDHKMMVDESSMINYGDKEDFEEFLEYAVVATQTTYDRYVSDILVGFEKATSDLLQIIREEHYELKPEPYERIKNYDKPSLILVGKQDCTVGYKDVLRLDAEFSNLSISMINKAGHGLQYEQVDIFNDLTLRWLKEFK